jgi:hypothetical protein
MTPEQRAAMYASIEEDAELDVEEPEEVETALENAGGGMVAIKVGEATATVPTVAYTKILEHRIAILERQLKNANNANRRLVVSLNQLIRAVSNLESQLDNKLDKPF